jgi:hypothetical protein
VERSHLIDSEEFYRLLRGQVIDDARLFADKLQEWEDYYNYYRPRGALAAKPPTNDYDRKHKTDCHRPLSVAHLRIVAQPRRDRFGIIERQAIRRGKIWALYV